MVILPLNRHLANLETGLMVATGGGPVWYADARHAARHLTMHGQLPTTESSGSKMSTVLSLRHSA